MLTIYADKNIYQLDFYIPPSLAIVKTYDPEKGLPEDVQAADALLVRTVTDINAKTLPLQDTNLKFVGTASAGTDHIDEAYLDKNGVAFAHSPGCNARAVAEYIMTALLIWAEKKDKKMQDFTVGIVGLGNVGTALTELLDMFDLEYIRYDPPRQEREKYFKSAAREDVLSADILTLHTPLTHSGNYATYHWLDAEKLADHEFEVVINASRGGVVDENALVSSYHSNKVNSYILDVWEDEPNFHDESARNAFIKTPHIAGYSEQAKKRATRMVCESMLQHLKIELPDKYQHSEQLKALRFDPDEIRDWSLTETLDHLHPLLKYNRRLGKIIGLTPEEKKTNFAHLRTNTPFRFEYGNIRISDRLIKKYPLLRRLGIRKLERLE